MNTMALTTPAPAPENRSVSLVEPRPMVVSDRALLGYHILFALFVAGLLSSFVVASKVVSLGGLVLPASVFVWALTYPLSDVVAELYGRRYANHLVAGGLVAMVLMFLTVQTSVWMPAAAFWPHQVAYQTVLALGMRVMLATLISYTVTQFLDVQLFAWIRRNTGSKRLWLRNNLSTFASQTTANIIFLTIAFLGAFPFEHWLRLFVTNLLARYALALSDTAMVYTVVGIYRRWLPELRQ